MPGHGVLRQTVAVAQGGDQPLVRPVVDIDEAEIVVLAVGPAAGRLVGVLEPVHADRIRRGRQEARRPAGAAGALGLGRDGHQVAGAVAVVADALLRVGVRRAGAV